MATTQRWKQENRHRHVVPVQRSPEELLELECTEAFVALEVTAGPRPRRFHKIAAGELHPTRIIARIVRDACEADVDPMALWRAITAPIRRFIERRYRKRLPAPPQGRFLPGV